MRDDPRRNLKWLEQELLAEDRIHRDFSKLPDPEYHKDEDLLERVDMLLEEDSSEEEPDLPIRNFANRYGKMSKGERAERAHTLKHLEESAFVPVKTKEELRRDAKRRKIAEKKAGVNRNIKDLVFLAILEIAGILAILGWWLQ